MPNDIDSRARSKAPTRRDESSIKEGRDSRNRSYSPQRDHKNQQPKHIAGFRWKEKRQLDNCHRDQDHHNSATSSTNYANNGSSNTGRLERGYRNRSRSPLTRRNSDQIRNLDNDNRIRGTMKERGSNLEEKFGSGYITNTKKSEFGEKERDFVGGKKNQHKASNHVNSSAAISGGNLHAGGGSGQQQEPMIIVHINDRLGTRAAIPCLASDPIALFKAQVAARIGRKPHEIMLKRQGERPFKDQLTLEDYGISNGVQIDLEIDTGD